MYVNDVGGDVLLKKEASSKNMQYLRTRNRIAILRNLAISGAESRVELAGRLGLTKMAITKIVSEMLQEHLLEECGNVVTLKSGHEAGSNGRPRMALRIPDYRINALGILVERHHLHCIAMDVNQNEIGHLDMPFSQNTDNETFIALLLDLLRCFRRTYPAYSYIGVGIASVGPLDVGFRTILKPTNFGRIHDVPIGDIVEAELGIPTFIANGVVASVLAESLYGYGKNSDNVVFFGLGNGVGAGIINHGRVIGGLGGYAGELGHMSINFNGPKCLCGRRGCVETYIGLYHLLRNTSMPDLQSLLGEIRGDTKDPAIRKAMSNYMQAVTSCLITIANSYAPELIVIGDKGSALVEPHLETYREIMNRKKLPRRTGDIALKISSFGQRAALIGAPSIVFDKLFSGDLVLPPTMNP